MKWILIILVIIVALVLAVVAIGYALPVKHVAIREARLRQSPEEVFLAITDVKNFPAWRPSVKHVEVLPANGHYARFREVGSDGTILFETDSVVPNQRLVNRIADPSLPFGGRWIYELTPDSGGTRVKITEEGEVYNPIYRFVSRFIIGHTSTIDRYLGDLSRR
jgi:ribosome-associated toxin RatA of RatAB toxin-antitoxin module